MDKHIYLGYNIEDLSITKQVLRNRLAMVVARDAASPSASSVLTSKQTP